MSDPDKSPVLARIVAAHRGAGASQASLVPGLQTGLTRAIRRAGQPFAGLTPQVAEVTATCDADLGAAIAALPEHGLLAAIEDDEGRRGLVALDHPLVDSLIEVQATGHVEETDLPPRVVTRIDEALCRDFLDLMFGAFAQETAAQAGRDWPDRMSYGSRIPDRSQLNLLLPDRGYHLLKVSVTAGGRKTGDVVMLLPTDPALAKRRAAPKAKAAPVDWSARMLDVLGGAPMVLDAVLMRVTMPLGQVEALVEGELVPFEPSDLAAVTLEDDTGHIFARGALGQVSGRRAVRLGGGPKQASTGPTHTTLPDGAAGGGGLAGLSGLPATADMLIDGGDPPGAASSPASTEGGVGELDPDAVLGAPDPTAQPGA